MKLLFANSPVTSCTFCTVLFMLVLSLVLRVSVSPLCLDFASGVYFWQMLEGPVNAKLTSQFSVTCWFTIVTMTTVGFGDVFPYTHLGRVTAVIAMIFGLLIAAAVTAALYTLLLMTAQEFRTQQFIRKYGQSGVMLFPYLLCCRRNWHRRTLHLAATVIQYQ